MLVFEVIEVQALSGLNLVAPVPGLMCRLRFDGQNTGLSDNILQEFVDCLSSVLGDEADGVVALKNMRSKGSADFLSFFFGQFVLGVQRAAGSSVSIVRQNPLDDHRHWDVFIEFEFENICRRAGVLAINVIRQRLQTTDHSIPLDEHINQIKETIASIKKGYLSEYPRPAVQEFTSLADKRGIPWFRLTQTSEYVRFGYGKHQQIFDGCIIGTESHTSAELANSKEMTTNLLRVAGLPVAKQIRVATEETAIQAAKNIGYPVVVKPYAGHEGHGITPNIQNAEGLKRAFARAQPFHRLYIVEKHIDGDDYRLLIIKGKYVGCVKRSISTVTGDGKRTIDELVTELNEDPWRNQFKGDDKYHVRKLDIIEECLKGQGYEWQSIPPVDEIIRLHIIPNISQGGTCEEIRDEIHPENIKMAERAASVLNLKVAGVDYLTTDISKPYWETGGGICEVNVNPGINVMFPSSSKDMKDLFRQAFELSFPPEKNVSLPVIVVLNDDRKIADKIVQILSTSGMKVGYRAKNHVEIDGSPLIIEEKGLAGAHAVLWNGIVDAAVIEETTNSVQKFGLGYTASTLVIFDTMPKIKGIPALEILDLLSQTATQSIMINGSDQSLTGWADERQDPRIIKVQAAEGERYKNALLQNLIKRLSIEAVDDV